MTPARTRTTVIAVIVLAFAACTRTAPVTIDKVSAVQAALEFTGAINGGETAAAEHLLSTTLAMVQWPGFWDTVRLADSGLLATDLAGYLGYAATLGAHTSLGRCTAFPGGSAPWADAWVDCRFTYRDALSDLDGSPISGAMVFGIGDGRVTSVQVVPPTVIASLGVRDWLTAQRPAAYRRLLAPGPPAPAERPSTPSRSASERSPIRPVYTPATARELLRLAADYPGAG